MSRSRRLQRCGVLLGAVMLLVGIAAGTKPAGVPEKLAGHASPAVTTTALLGSGAGGAADTRVHRDVEAGKRQPGSRLDGAVGSPALARPPQLRATALAAVLERAGHPERLGHILLRGPPTASA